jgi:glycine cleavage system transcriptional repressor
MNIAPRGVAVTQNRCRRASQCGAPASRPSVKGRFTVRTNIVFTLTGTDRVGIVDEITQLLLNLGGNIETSRMTRLGGEFAILVLVSLPSERLGALEQAIPQLIARGYRVTTTRTEPNRADGHAGWVPFQVDVQGADHEGIIHEIAHTLSQCGITIESMDTGTSRAPNSGATLFTMTARIVVPPNLPGPRWETSLEEAAHLHHVEITVSAVAGQ